MLFRSNLLDHEARYEHAQEWLDVIRRAWSEEDDFDFEGKFIQLRQVRAKPKPVGGERPVAGLTVVSFPNNHLVYAITWYALAAMMAGAVWWVARDERRHCGQG